MRKIDRYVGVPLCTLFTFFYKIKCFFIVKPHLKTPSKILLIKLFGLGSIVLMEPAVSLIKKRFPKSELYFLTFSGNKKIVDLLKLTDKDKILSVNAEGFFVFVADLIKIFKHLWAEKIDVVLDFEFFSRFTAILSFLIRSKHRVGFYNHHIEGMYRGNFITHGVYYNHHQHMVDNFMNLGEALYANENEVPLIKSAPSVKKSLPQINIGDADKVSILSKIKALLPEATDQNNIYLLNPNTSSLGGHLRRWPAEKFAELSEKIKQTKQNPIIAFIGSPKERHYNQRIINSINNKSGIVNLAGEIGLDELLHLFSISKCLITSDSGPMHLACLTPIKIIAMFSTEAPELFGPVSENAIIIKKPLKCSPCLTVYNGKKPVCNNNICMKNISVTDILQHL